MLSYCYIPFLGGLVMLAAFTVWRIYHAIED